MVASNQPLEPARAPVTQPDPSTPDETTPQETPPDPETASFLEDFPNADPLLLPLIKLLAAGITDLTTLTDKLQATPQYLRELMTSKAFAEYEEIQNQISQASFRIRMRKLLPQAAQTLENNLTCGKPEVERRAAVTIFHANHIPTTSPKRKPWAESDLRQDGTRPKTDPDPIDTQAYAGLGLLQTAHYNYFTRNIKTHIIPDAEIIETLTKLQAGPGAMPIYVPG